MSMDKYCDSCKLLNEFCVCDHDGPLPQHNFEVFASLLIRQALGIIAHYKAISSGGQRVGSPQMPLSVAKDIVRTAKNVAILDWYRHDESQRGENSCGFSLLSDATKVVVTPKDTE